MNNKEYRDLKKRADERYQKAMDAAQNRHIEEIRAIDTVWQMEHPPRKTRDMGNNAQPDIVAGSWGALASAVKEALKHVPATFTKTHIRTALKQIAPEVEAKCKESSLTGRLIRLAKEGVIEQTKAGKGSSPSEYQLKQLEKPEDLFEPENMKDNTA